MVAWNWDLWKLEPNQNCRSQCIDLCVNGTQFPLISKSKYPLQYRPRIKIALPFIFYIYTHRSKFWTCKIFGGKILRKKSQHDHHVANKWEQNIKLGIRDLRSNLEWWFSRNQREIDVAGKRKVYTTWLRSIFGKDLRSLNWADAYPRSSFIGYDGSLREIFDLFSLLFSAFCQPLFFSFQISFQPSMFFGQFFWNSFGINWQTYIFRICEKF